MLRWLVLGLLAWMVAGCAKQQDPLGASQAASKASPTALPSPPKPRVVYPPRPPLGSLPVDQDLVAATLSGRVYVSDRSATGIIGHEVRTLLQEERWDDLEALAAEFRAHPSTMGGGYRKLNAFYTAFAEPAWGEPSFGFLGLQYWLGRWRAARPDSITAATAEARMLLAYARFLDQGAGLAMTLGGAPAPEPQALVDRAETILQKLEKRGVEDPHAWCLMMWLDRDRARPREQMERHYREAVKLDPGFLEAYKFKAEYLRPDRHGHEGDGLAWAVEEGSRGGDLAYARVLLAHDGTWGAEFRAAKLDWNRARGGLLQMQRAEPGNLFLANRIAWLACQVDDFETGREALELVGERPDLVNQWRNWEEFARFRARVVAGTRPLDPARALPGAWLAVGREVPYFPDPVDQGRPFELQVRTLLEQERYVDLVAIRDALLKELPKRGDRHRSFYTVLGGEDLEEQPDTKHALQELMCHLEAWTKAMPASEVPRLARADVLVELAWEARGTGWASSVTPWGWQQMADRLREAMGFLAAVDPKSRDPERLYARMPILLGAGGTVPEVEAAFREARRLDPASPRPYLGMAYFLTPRWHGAPGDTEAFLRAHPERPDLMARGAAMLFSLEEDRLFQNTDLEWSELPSSFAAWRKEPGEARRADNWEARLAGIAGEREAARRAFGRITRWSPEVWKLKAHYEAWQAWASGSGPLPSRPARAVAQRSGVFERAGKGWKLVQEGSTVAPKAGTPFGVEIRWVSHPLGLPLRVMTTITPPSGGHVERRSVVYPGEAFPRSVVWDMSVDAGAPDPGPYLFEVVVEGETALQAIVEVK